MRFKKENYKILKSHIIDRMCIKQMLIRTNQVDKINTELKSLEVLLYPNISGSSINASFNNSDKTIIMVNSDLDKHLKNNEISKFPSNSVEIQLNKI